MKLSKLDRELEEAAERWIKAGRDGTASAYIWSFDVIEPGDPVFIVLCVSACDRITNLDDAERRLRGYLAESKAIVVGEPHKEVGPRFWPDEWLPKVVRKAKAAGAKWMLAEMTDRLVRNRHFEFNKSPRNDYQASDDQLQALIAAAGGMPLVTYLHPDTPPEEVRTYRSFHGQESSGNKGGYPSHKSSGYKKRLKDRVMPEVLRLASSGLSPREIESRTKVDHCTAWRWIKASTEPRNVRR
jgi:hypothetical protein